MPWLLASPGHQHQWHWLCRIGRSLSYTRKDFNYLWHVNVEQWHKMYMYVDVPSEKFPECQALSSMYKGHSLLTPCSPSLVWSACINITVASHLNFVDSQGHFTNIFSHAKCMKESSHDQNDLNIISCQKIRKIQEWDQVFIWFQVFCQWQIIWNPAKYVKPHTWICIIKFRKWSHAPKFYSFSVRSSQTFTPSMTALWAWNVPNLVVIPSKESKIKLAFGF